MKGRSAFTKAEAETIKKLIAEKLVSEKDVQKKIRKEIRKNGFYISDFTNKKKYTASDFEEYTTIKN